MDEENPLFDKWRAAKWRGIMAVDLAKFSPQMTATQVNEWMRQASKRLDKVKQQLWESAMAGIQKKNEGEQEKQEIPSADLGYEIPDTSGLTKRLDDARIANLQREHQAEEEEDEKDEKQGGERRKKRPKKTVGQICFCMNPSCRIGEFIEVEKEDVE